MPLPYACCFNAPEAVNVFTDGSWLYPMKQFLGMGGAGAWWPSRTLNRVEGGPQPRPLSSAQLDMAHPMIEEHGIELHTKIGGFFGSSTRTELAADIVAISAHVSVHIGSDSEVFVESPALKRSRVMMSLMPWRTLVLLCMVKI